MGAKRPVGQWGLNVRNPPKAAVGAGSSYSRSPPQAATAVPLA